MIQSGGSLLGEAGAAGGQRGSVYQLLGFCLSLCWDLGLRLCCLIISGNAQKADKNPPSGPAAAAVVAEEVFAAPRCLSLYLYNLHVGMNEHKRRVHARHFCFL